MARSDSPPVGIAEDVPDAIPTEVARTIVLRAITHAPKTRKQLADLLAKRQVPQDAADEVLDRFIEVGLINDADYANEWVRQRHLLRKTSRSVLRMELRTKGIGDALIEEALAQIDNDDEYQAARELAERKLRQLSQYDEATKRRRVGSLLMRKGYSGTLANQVVSELISTEIDEYCAD